MQAYASVSHTSADKHIFVPTAYHPNTEKAVRHDIALIYFTPDEQDQWYVHTTTGQSLNYKTFIKELNSSSYPEQLNQWQALQQARPALLRVSNMDNRRITVPVAVPDLRQGEIYFKQSQPNDFYYSNQLRYYVGKNFGVGQGMSGSAVVVPGGKIIGIVSMNKQQAGNLVAYNEKDEPVAQIPFSTDYFLFTPISRENASFIQNTIRSMHDSGKTARVERLSDAESEITDKNLQEIIDSFLPVPASVPVAQ